MASRGAGGLALASCVLVAVNALVMVLVAFGNITDYDTNEPFVRHVLAMDTTNFGAPEGEGLDDDVMWRAIGNDTLQTIAYIAIIVWETLTAIVLVVATGAWIRAFVRGVGDLTARSLATIGLLMVIALFFGGFIAIGGEWFQMWKSTAWNGIDSAFRYGAIATLALIVVHLPTSPTDW